MSFIDNHSDHSKGENIPEEKPHEEPKEMNRLDAEASEEGIEAEMPTPGEQISQPLTDTDINNQNLRQSQDERKSPSESNSNNIFITEKPGEHEDQDEQQEEAKEHELTQDKKQDEPIHPADMEGQVVPYSEQAEMEVVYSEEEIASFRNIFDMFDKEKTGFITVEDFKSIMETVHHSQTEMKEDESQELLDEFGFGQETGKISFDEFIVLMQALEKRMIVDENQEVVQRPEGEGEGDAENQLVEVEDHESPRSATEEERAQYG